MIDYGTKNKKEHNLFAIDNFFKCGWSIAVENKISQTVTNEFSDNIRKSNRKPSLIEIDNGKCSWFSIRFCQSQYKTDGNKLTVHKTGAHRMQLALFVDCFKTNQLAVILVKVI